jgi:hypothetical protein
MQKLTAASLFLFILIVLQNSVFATSMDCKFKDQRVEGIKSIQIVDDSLILNQEMEIPLEKSRVICGNFGKQVRFDGNALGYQVILKSCSTDAKLEGHIVDSLNVVAADVHCHPAKTAVKP